MKLIFLGTRGGIIARSSLHKRHASLLITHGKTTLIIDWGKDWLTKTNLFPADALFITHAHIDHSGGLSHGASFPVYATKESWNTLGHYPIQHKKIITPYKPQTIGTLTITAFPVEHSLRAPAVGYKISSSTTTIFYVPDLAKLPSPHKTLADVDVYIGDGAILTRHILLRTKNHTLTGHAPITDQLAWCKKAHVTNAIFTHCGTEIVTSNADDVQQTINFLTQWGIQTKVAYDGMVITL